ncbi:hypothetical protein KSF_083440 [Reticulibacter mediterranei]|uniref:Uncharacterized protein n=1 Tax=Reticulibacter mediterranei TaxID=2778369 RepID=A0A8J3IYA9_9CHLR|nr:hypothetical protein KSF_083440 [Reticulibacter mediterranei]
MTKGGIDVHVAVTCTGYTGDNNDMREEKFIYVASISFWRNYREYSFTYRLDHKGPQN